MHRAALALVTALVCAAAPLRAEIRSVAACEAAVAADPEAAREEASAWARLGGGSEAEICEAMALEAMGAAGSAALILTRLAENPNRALDPGARLAVYEDAAQLWLDADRPDLALEVLDNLDRLAPAPPERLRLRAEAAAALGDWPGARESLDALIAAEPDDAPAHALRAAALRMGGDPQAARTEADAALALAPGLPEGLFEAGAASAEAGNAEEARRLWMELIEIHPDHPLSTYARRNLVALDRPAEAPAPAAPSGPGPRPRP